MDEGDFLQIRGLNFAHPSIGLSLIKRYQFNGSFLVAKPHLSMLRFMATKFQTSSYSRFISESLDFIFLSPLR